MIGNPNAPYLTYLASAYGQATRYYGVTHPSLPNYVATISGSNWFVNDDNPHDRFPHTNLVDQLEAHDLTWGAYMDAMPRAGFLGSQWPSYTALYANKHNPFVLFGDIRHDPARMAHVKPYTDFAGDLWSGRVPNFVFISPDQCNDMHGGVYSAVPGTLRRRAPTRARTGGTTRPRSSWCTRATTSCGARSPRSWRAPRGGRAPRSSS